jgi:hypothetical protein
MKNCSTADRAIAGKCGPDRPARTSPSSSFLLGAELKQISEGWGEELADALISDKRWPMCDQLAAIRTAASIMDQAVARIVAILDASVEFREHTPAMAITLRAAFWNSMPNGRTPKKGTNLCS